MESVLSAEKFSLLLASFCKVVRSYKSGGSWLVSFLSTDFTVSCPVAFTLCNAAMASGCCSHLAHDWAEKLTPLLAVVAFSCQNLVGTKSLFSKKRLHIITSVGVCTRPSENTPCPAATLNAWVAFIPINQSASLRACAER